MKTLKGKIIDGKRIIKGKIRSSDDVEVKDTPFFKALERREKAVSKLAKPGDVKAKGANEIIYKDGTSEYEYKTRDSHTIRERDKSKKVIGPV